MSTKPWLAACALGALAAAGCNVIFGIDDRPGAVAGGGAAAMGGGAGMGGEASGGAMQGGGGAGGAAQGGGGGGGSGGAGCGDGYRLAVEADNPVAYIRFEETTGTTVADEYGLVGTVEGGVELDEPPLLACGGASAARFLGALDAYILFGQVLAFDGQASFSLELWVVADALEGTLIRKLTASPQSGYSLAFDNSNLYFRRYNSGNATSVAADSSIVGGAAPRHVVGTYDGIAQQMCLYVDGVLVECGSSALNLASASGTFRIGTNAFSDVIDEVAVYAHALSDAQVAAHFAAAMDPSR